MKNNYCVHEEEIIGALRKGFVPEHLSRHITQCDPCRELLDITTFIKEEAIRATEEARPPSAGFLWWKSQLQKRHRCAMRAARPIAIMEIITPPILACILILTASYLNYSLEPTVLQGVSWAVIIVSTMITFACMAVYWISAKNRIDRQSKTHLGK